MVSFYKQTKKKRTPKSVKGVTVERLDMHGTGVSRSQQPVMFVEGALPGEQVDVCIEQSQKQSNRARLTRVVKASASRQSPFCPIYEKCGGCQLQHIGASEALMHRQAALDSHWANHLGEHSLPWQQAITGERPAYRRKARFAIDARDPDNIKFGFRQQNSKSVTDVGACPVLVPELQALLPALRAQLKAFPASRNIGHIQMLAGDNVCEITVKATRDLPAVMLESYGQFGLEQGANISLHNAAGEYQVLHHEADLRCSTTEGFYLTPSPEDFVQVNKAVNEQMVMQAIQWLAPDKDDVVADWFAGLGNFSLPLATKAGQVYAVEGVAQMVQKGRAAAQAQGITNVDWQHLDLNDQAGVRQSINHGFSKMLLDPSREGAAQVCLEIGRAGVPQVLYVSCNPSSFTRDAQILLQAGYKIEKIGLIEMFPYTRHLEVMALFSLVSD